MAVLLVIDTFHIDSKPAIDAEMDLSAIQQLRQRITQHLKDGDESLLRIRFKNQALYERFKDFEGLDNVLPTQHLLPRLRYRDQVDQVLPDWLSDELIVKLNLLDGQEEDSSGFALIDRIIRACDINLLSRDFNIFIETLRKQPEAFWQLLLAPDVQQRFLEHFHLAFEFSEDLASLFLEKVLEAQPIDQFLILLAYEQHQELLRKKLAQFQFNISLPPKSLPMSLLNIPLLELTEENAKTLPAKCIKALEELARNVEKGKAEASDIVSLIIAPWPTLLNKLAGLCKRNGQLIVTPLIEKLESFHSEPANQLADEFKKHINLTQFSTLPTDATTEDVLQWSEDYFKLIRQQFLANQTTNEVLNLSFTEWLVKQSARVARSDSDWRQFSKRVERFLQQGYLVVVCVIDALSALNQDLLLECASQVEHLDLSSEMLFAPLPTLTEIGKMAIVTGMPTTELPNDQETAIRQRYQAYLPDKNSLKVIKSWRSAPEEHIDENTHLVVFFENRIDERLHDCIDFSKHRKDVLPILKQTMTSIDNWKKDAGYMNRDIVFLITADHGMTVTQSDYHGQVLGEAKERVFKTKGTVSNDCDDFVFIGQSLDHGYLVPKERVRLDGDALLTHGGLTPEEVLVPFVTLFSRQPEAIKMPLELSVMNDKCQRIADKTWQLSVQLFASVAVRNVLLKLESPLVGEESIAVIDAGANQKLLLTFSSPSDQVGLTEITIHISYDREGAHEINTTQFSCVFPAALIEKDAETQGFEDMFN